MALLEILQAPHPVLKTKAKPVARVDDGLRRLAADMFETMYKAPGIGLAAPQVGVSERLIVLDVTDGDERRPMTLVNPEIVWRSSDRATAEEGCLSLPGHFADVTRPQQVKVSYLTEQGARAPARGGGSARPLRPARDRPSRRYPVRRSPHGAEAQHDPAQADQDPAAACLTGCASWSWARPASSCPASRR